MIKGSNVGLEKMYNVAQDLLYDAKCQVAIGDEDPKDANPQFSLKAFKQHILQKQERLKSSPKNRGKSSLHREEDK